MVRGGRVILGLSAVLWLAIAGLVYACTPARAQVDKQSLVNNINTLFADNIVNAITAAQLRFITTEIVSSYVDFITCQSSGGLVYWTTTASPTASPFCLPRGTAGQFLQTGTITPSWINLVSALISGRSIGITGTITPTIAVSDIALNNLSDLITTGYLIRSASTSPVYTTGSISGTVGQVITTNNTGVGGTTTISLTAVTNLLDSQFGSAQGSVLFRSATGWAVLTPGVSGTVLSSGGSGNNVSYVAVAGTGTVTSLLCGTGLTCTPNPIIGSGTITPTIATSAQVWGAVNYPLIDAEKLNEVGNPVTLIMTTATVTLDLSLGVDFNLTLNTTPTFVNPVVTTSQTGRTGCIWITQPTTTTYQPGSFGANWKFSNGVSPSFTTSAGGVDLMCYKARTTSFVGFMLNNNFK